MGPSLRIYSSLLFLTGLLCDKLILASLQDDLLHADTRGRLLQQASCGDTLGTVTADQIRQVGLTYLDTLLSPELQATTSGIVNQTSNVLFQTAVNDVTVMKMCGSCETLIRDFFNDNGRVFPNFHFTYCAGTAYGWDSLHSSLVLLPIDPETGELFDQARLRSFISLTTSRLDFGMAPTEIDLVGTMQAATSTTGLSANELLPFLTEYLAGMMAASSGTVAIFPDKTGYGESRATQNRTTFSPMLYQQAAVVAYFTVEYYVRDSTNGCTLLDKAVMVHGNGDGGFAAPFVADAIRRFNFQILNVYAAGPPLDLETFLLDSIATMDANATADSDTQVRDELFLLAAFSFSAETPGFNNTGSEFSLLSAAMRDGIVGAMSSTTEGDLSTMLPDNLANILNTDILVLFRNANDFQVERPCDGSIGQGLCREVLKASAWRVLSGEVARLVIPIELCYSTADTILSANQFPAKIFTDAEDDVTVFAGPTGLDELAPVGDHERSLRLCSLSPMLFYSLNGHRPVSIQDRGNFMPALEGAQLQECPATRKEFTDKPTPAPGSTPMPSPTMSSSTSMPSPTSSVTKKEYNTFAATLVGAFALMAVL